MSTYVSSTITRTLFGLLMAITLVVFVGGCDTTTGPPTVSHAHVTGSVSYPNGQIVWRAKLTASTGDTAFTDTLGVYSLAVPVSTDSVWILARDGYTPGRAYGGYHYSAVIILPDRDRTVHFVLDHEIPF